MVDKKACKVRKRKYKINQETAALSIGQRAELEIEQGRWEIYGRGKTGNGKEKRK